MQLECPNKTEMLFRFSNIIMLYHCRLIIISQLALTFLKSKMETTGQSVQSIQSQQ